MTYDPQFTTLFLGASRLVCIAFVGAAVFVAALISWTLIQAWWEVRDAPKTDFYTCDKHGAFPTKFLLDLPLNDGGAPIKQCPFCYSEAFKKADAALKSREVRHGSEK